MDKQKIEVIKWKLSELANSEPEDIESNDLEIMGEDDQGRDGYCTVQITDLAQESLDAFKNMEDESEWLIKTLKWMSDPESNGGITTCDKHNGHGFISDCAICERLKEI